MQLMYMWLIMYNTMLTFYCVVLYVLHCI